MMTAARSSVTGTDPAASAWPTSWRLSRCDERPGPSSPSAEVDDLAHAGGGRGVTERLRSQPVAGGEVGGAPHGVDEEVGGVHAGERLDQGVGVGDVAPRRFDVVAPGQVVELRGGAGQAADGVPGGEQLGDEAAADVAGGPHLPAARTVCDAMPPTLAAARPSSAVREIPVRRRRPDPLSGDAGDRDQDSGSVASGARVVSALATELSDNV